MIALCGMVAGRRRLTAQDAPPPDTGSEENELNPYRAPVVPPPLPVSDDLAPTGRFDRVRVSWVRGFDFLIIGAILSLYLWPLVLALLGKLPEEAAKIELVTLISTMVMQILFAVLIVGVVFWRIKAGTWLGMAWPGKSGVEWAKFLVSVPVCIGATWMFFSLLYFTGYIEWVQSIEGGDGQQEVVKAFQEIEDPLTLVMLVVMAAIVAPVTEEIIFRGYLYPVLKSRTGRTAAIIVSALVFAAVHHNAIALAPLAFLAILLAISFEFTGSIWLPMAIHAAFNTFTVIGQLLVKFGYIPTPAS